MTQPAPMQQIIRQYRSPAGIWMDELVCGHRIMSKREVRGGLIDDARLAVLKPVKGRLCQQCGRGASR